MGLINNIKETGKTIYEVDIKTLTKMVALDLNVPEAAVIVEHYNILIGGSYNHEEYIFGGLKVTVDHCIANNQVVKLQYPTGVRGDTQFGDH